MRVPRFLLLSALVLISVRVAAAQAPVQRHQAPSPPRVNERGLNLFAAPQATPSEPLWRKWLHRDSAASHSMFGRTDKAKGPQANEQCYTIRDYNFTQDEKSPDVTRFKGKTTCAPAGEVKMKGAKGR